MARDDKHRPSQIKPDEYRFLFPISYPSIGGAPGFNMALLAATRSGRPMKQPIYGVTSYGAIVITGYETVQPFGGEGKAYKFFNKRKHGSKAGGCDICGAFHIHGEVWQHIPTGECIIIGEICAEKYHLFAQDKRAWKEYKTWLAKARKERRKFFARRKALRTWAREHRDVTRLLKMDHRIARDMRARLIRSPEWGLTDKQIALLKKLATQPERPEEKRVPVPETEARLRIEGTVISLKETDFGRKMTVKVETSDGFFLLWGSVPGSLISMIQKGSRVRFTAKVQRGNRDESFGFFKRPAKAEFIK